MKTLEPVKVCELVTMHDASAWFKKFALDELTLAFSDAKYLRSYRKHEGCELVVTHDSSVLVQEFQDFI